jgi:hypothetical protein
MLEITKPKIEIIPPVLVQKESPFPCSEFVLFERVVDVGSELVGLGIRLAAVFWVLVAGTSLLDVVWRGREFL